MKATKLFIEVISDYLKKEAQNDKEFAQKMKEQPEKTPEKVCEYIMAEVSKSRQMGYADEEIFGMAKHFIDEKELKTADVKGNRVSAVVVNKSVGLSDEDKAEAMKKAEEAFKLELEKKQAAKEKEEREKAETLKAKKREKLLEKEKQDMQGSLFGDLFQ